MCFKFRAQNTSQELPKIEYDITYYLYTWENGQSGWIPKETILLTNSHSVDIFSEAQKESILHIHWI